MKNFRGQCSLIIIIDPQDIILLNPAINFEANDTAPQTIKFSFKEDRVALERNEDFMLEIPSNFTSLTEKWTVFRNQLIGTIQDSDGMSKITCNRFPGVAK